MALVFTNSAEGQTSGTTVTTANSGGTSGTAFTNVAVGTGVGITFDNAHAAHGSNAYKIAISATSATLTLRWNQTIITPGATTSYGRLSAYLTANPPGNMVLSQMLTSAGSRCMRLLVSPTGKLISQNSGAITATTSTASVPLNQWFRAEYMTVSSATVGQLETKLFTNVDDINPVETNTSAANLNTFGGNIQQYEMGIIAALASQTIWLDDLAFSDTAYLGPASKSLILNERRARRNPLLVR